MNLGFTDPFGSHIQVLVEMNHLSVSVDFNHNTHSDGSETNQMSDQEVKGIYTALLTLGSGR